MTGRINWAPASADALAPTWVPLEEQWLASTRSRFASDGFSWLQAVHWTVKSGAYVPRRAGGPRTMGRTTVLVAQELTRYSPCRPGVERLARKLGLSERTVEYHLSMLREAGLLVYVERGTRWRGGQARASEYRLAIPPAFDHALGVRTAGEGAARRMVGISCESRELMARLAKLAARRLRPRKPTAPPAKASAAPERGVGAARSGESAAVSRESLDVSERHSRCAPMGGGPGGSVRAGSPGLPQESKLASGNPKSVTAEKASGRGKLLNTVGRRYQLAAQLVREVPWLRRTPTPRVAWVIRGVADAGWTLEEVVAWLDAQPIPSDGPRRGSGLLAFLLKVAVGAPGWETPRSRARAVDQWRDSRRAARQRHAAAAGWNAQDWAAPTSRAVARMVDAALTTLGAGPGGGQSATPEPVEQVSDEGLRELRDRAWGEYRAGDPVLVRCAIQTAGRAGAEGIYGPELVRRVELLESRSARMRVGAAA